MGFTKKSNNKGMGFLLVFFPEEQQQQQSSETKKNLFSSSSPSSSSSSTSLFRQCTNSTQLLHKAQSTISICLLLLFTTLLVFTLSTLPNSNNNNLHFHNIPYHVNRRHLNKEEAHDHVPSISISSKAASNNNLSHALQGIGTLYRRGTRAMSDLIVVHLVESLTTHDLKLFVRLLYRSSIASRSDVLFLFHSKRSDFDDVILRETRYFLELLSPISNSSYTHSGSSSPSHSVLGLSFDPAHFLMKTGKKEKDTGEPIWGRKIRANSTDEGGLGSTRLSYGSVVSFEVDELDPENALSGFLDHASPPMSLRRWACYPMLLGRVRHNFKHVILVDAKEMLLLGDPLSGGVRNQSPETITVRHVPQPQSRHGRVKNPDKNGPTRIHPGFVMGGSRGVRRLSNAMLNAIVRASPPGQHKKKNNMVTESGIFNQLVGNEFALKDVNKIVSGDMIPELSSLVGSGLKSGMNSFLNNTSSYYTVIRRGNSNLDVISNMVMKHICSFALDSMVYSDC